jgi:hypothetical protein
MQEHLSRVTQEQLPGANPNMTKNPVNTFTKVWPDAAFVQQVLAQLTWYHQLALLDQLDSHKSRERYRK